MSQDVRTRPADSGDRASLDGLDGLDGGPSVSATDVLDRLWRFFISMRTGLLLILGLGLLSLVGTLLAQAPAGMTADPAAYASWVASIHSKYGGWTPVLDKLGFFSIFTSIWFKAMTVLLTTSILACSVNRAPRLWKIAFHPRTRMGETFFTHAALRANILVPTSPDTAMDDVREVLKSHRFRTITDPDDNGLNLYADRFRWGPFGTVVAHLSFVIILLGFFLSATTGFKDTQFVAPVGSKVQVGHGTGLTVEAKSFNDAYYPDGSPSDYVSDLVVYKNGAQVDRQSVRVNHPLTWDGVSFYQSFFGVAAAMQVKDAAGKTVFGDAVPLVWASDDGKKSIGKFDMAGKGLEGYALTLRFSNGGVGLVNVNCLEGEHNNWSERVAVTGVGGRVFVENWRRVIGFLPDSPTYYWEPEDIRPADDQNSLAVHGFVGELRDFVESVREGRAPACTIDDGLAALRLEQAINLSVERHCTVLLSEVQDDGK